MDHNYHQTALTKPSIKMDTKTVTDVRRENLEQLIAVRFDSNNAAFCRATGKHQNLINLILTKNTALRRNMGERLARDIERALSLPVGYLDVPRQSGVAGGSLYTFPVVRLDALDSSGMEKIVIGADMAGRHLDSPSAMSAVRGCYMTSDEMAPSINKDDLMFVDAGAVEFDRDGIYVIVRNKDVFIRRVRRLLTGGIRISSDGDKDGAIDAAPGKFKSMGRVVGLMRFGQP